MIDATSARLLAISRVESGDMLVFEDAVGAFAARAKRVLGNRPVLAVRSQPGSQTVLGNPLDSVQYIGREQTALIRSVMICNGSDGFHRIVCLGRRDLSNRTCLPDFLEDWEQYLAPGGRIVVEMYRSGNEHWKTVEAAYRHAIRTTGFDIEQINGVERDAIFLTGAVDMYAYSASIKQTARLISTLDQARAQLLMDNANILQARLKRSKKTQAVESILDDIVGGPGHRLFATLRLG